ncbi:23S rRNA (pseudouridine(1915)-N(3))-methyltransferase RlmH [Roseicyclus persicicus]|uniref:Ribosomal RNA large subunit methyltransferase H n=1 Tax=Roseicyclus persicicus TaxID=2650661 RepID=A0A7X6GZF1_9RHOB|nr:23S rRNA (pseudouridine(1915)-N(3))-methyltransferase RlmH [Roseibacterium persicicum]NKX45212.1 23S rRNA (pseudouridine(1915)-N(3))-methyltransferase RlmH [Roseibacterium persicicum]
MKVHVCAVGRLRGGPEQQLIDDYLARFDRTGRALGLTSGGVTEVEDRKGGGKPAEAELLRRAVPKGAALWVLDERGETLTSPDFAARLAAQRDAGQGDLAICIGGADGLAADLCAEASLAVSLGRMVWPHMLVRVMLAEQLYRAASILSGGPYHRA